MTSVVIIKENGKVQGVFCRNKNVEAEVLDFDIDDKAKLSEYKKRRRQVMKAATYNDILKKEETEDLEAAEE